MNSDARVCARARVYACMRLCVYACVRACVRGNADIMQYEEVLGQPGITLARRSIVIHFSSSFPAPKWVVKWGLSTYLERSRETMKQFQAAAKQEGEGLLESSLVKPFMEYLQVSRSPGIVSGGGEAEAETVGGGGDNDSSSEP